ncbi:MAG: 4-hydroxy-3-methylbut-2-enyl diphosphate reductase [Bacilli bacterium]
MKVLKISPRGYCYGVVDAMVLARTVAQDPTVPRPIYILGNIVHNKHVTDAFTEEGIVTLDGPDRLSILEQVTEGTVIFTAHGVSPEVKSRAIAKGLHTVDATCPDVTKTHDLIREKLKFDYEILYIGKKGHPEPEGAVGIAPNQVHLIETMEDLSNISVSAPRILVTNQTTMSQWDVKHLMDAIAERYPHAEFHKEICMATQVRQEAVADQAGEADLTIVVGDPKSNNSNRLAQVSEEIAGTRAFRVSNVEELELTWFEGVESVAVTSGASTPTIITREVIDWIEKYDPADESTWVRKTSVPLQKILPRIGKKA